MQVTAGQGGGLEGLAVSVTLSDRNNGLEVFEVSVLRLSHLS